MDSPKAPFDDPGFSGKGEEASGKGSSATGAFGTVSGPKSARDEDDLLKSLMGQANAPVAVGTDRPLAVPVGPSASASASPASASPGEFTQMLKALNTMPAAAPATPKQSGDLENLFKKVSIEKTPPPAPPTAAPASSFTQMFSTMAARPEEQGVGRTTQAPVASQGSQPTQELPASPAQGPGDFTKMFQAVQGEKQPAPSELGKQPPPPVQPRSAPGSFTQMFSTLSSSTTPRQDAPELKQEFRQEPKTASDFQFSSPSRAAEPPAQGGFTQLLQALNQDAAPKASEPPPLAPVSPAPSASPVAGGFTQLLRTLSAEPTASEPLPIQPPAQAAVAPPLSGPGEFTRVISGSALRDLQAPAAPSAPGASGASGAASSAGSPVFAPLQMPKIPSAPPVPQIPQMPHAAGASAAPAAVPHFAPPPFAFPPAPAPAPPAAAAVAESGKLQKYLPLILVVNVFVLLVIVLILIFVLRHK